MSPAIFGVMVVTALAFWIRVTPVVLWLASMAMVRPAAPPVTVVLVAVTVPAMPLVLVMLLSEPDRSTMAEALPMSPVRAPLMDPLLTRVGTLAPASIRMPVACETRLEVDTPEIAPSFTNFGVVTPDRTWTPAPSFSKPWPLMVPVEATWMPPSMFTAWPLEPPIWTPVPE